MGRMSTGTGMISMKFHIYMQWYSKDFFIWMCFLMKTVLFRMLLQKLRYMKQAKKRLSFVKRRSFCLYAQSCAR